MRQRPSSPTTVASIHGYLNDTMGVNNFSKTDVDNYLNTVTTKSCSARNNQIRMLLDSGANFFAFRPDDEKCAFCHITIRSERSSRVEIPSIAWTKQHLMITYQRCRKEQATVMLCH